MPNDTLTVTFDRRIVRGLPHDALPRYRDALAPTTRLPDEWSDGREQYPEPLWSAPIRLVKGVHPHHKARPQRSLPPTPTERVT